MIYTLLEAASDFSETLTYRDHGCTRMGFQEKTMVVFGFEQRFFSTYSISITKYRVGCSLLFGMSQCDERSATFPSLRWTIGDGVTSGIREKDGSKTKCSFDCA